MRKNRVVIDPILYERVCAAATARGYASPAEFIHHVLDKATAETPQAPDAEILRERLRGLGYLE